MPRILITGITGFIGTHLVNILDSEKNTINGISFPKSENSNIQSLNVKVFEGDIRDQVVVRKIINETQPEIIFHLAGILKTNNLEDLLTVNIKGTLNLFESIISTGINPKVLVASSSAVYGISSVYNEISEGSSLNPVTQYGISKTAQEAISLIYKYKHKIPVICIRLFNLFGPGQSVNLALSSFSRQIALAEINENINEIFVGNLSTRRDLIDVRDAVKALDLIAHSDASGDVYNVCSGKAVSMKECLDILLSFSKKKLSISIDNNLLQQNDVPIQVGNPERLRNVINWRPRIHLKDSLRDILDYWRKNILEKGDQGELAR